MSNPLVECIPNFSEARRPEVVEAIMQSITAVNGVHVLDRHSDLDHNRTVVTFVGAPEAVEEAAFQGTAAAAKWIDLNIHTGEHPRIGATDVIPFVPISDISMQECVEMARRLGKRIGSELSIPVYLYEEAATRPERQNLENIRRGQYEGLKVEIKENAERKPEFGPSELSPAGATVVGARQPLIAYNIYLTTDDVRTAQKIAKTVRYSSGGLHFVKAMGVLVEGRAQVSMNLTNFRQTSLPRAVEMVRREAQRYGVAVHHSELVGLIPQEALVDSAVWYMQLDEFQPEQILENKLGSIKAGQKDEAVSKASRTFLDDLASGSPAPGGGSASAFTGAAAAALVAMVARVTIGKKKYANVEAQMWTLLDKAETLRAELTGAVQEDAAAFDGYLAAVRLPKETPEQIEARSAALQTANLGTIQVPLKVATLAVEVLTLSVDAAASGNVNAISDAGSAAALSRAALTGAGLNVRINLLNLEDQEKASNFLQDLRELEEKAAELEKNLHAVLIERGGLADL
jgi:glutamate formiminotransferase/formiminotetrahydrofolate cyclodeaminase